MAANKQRILSSLSRVNSLVGEAEFLNLVVDDMFDFADGPCSHDLPLLPLSPGGVARLPMCGASELCDAELDLLACLAPADPLRREESSHEMPALSHCDSACDTLPHREKRKAFGALLCDSDAGRSSDCDVRAKRRRSDFIDAAPCTACDSRQVFELPTGELRDSYELTGRVLGSGQFGSVQECVDKVTGQEFACKTIKKARKGADVASADEVAERVRNEAALLLWLSGHENVVHLHGVFEDAGEVHLVMDLCEGGELFAEVERSKGGLPEADAAHIFAQLVKAVAFCHSRGVLHRDLKPENVLLTLQPQTGSKTVKLADFGLATTLAPGQKATGLVGSPFYVAPEVLTSSYDSKADVWSLGVILYILLSGSQPFWGETDREVFSVIEEGEVEFWGPCWDRVSKHARGLVRMLLRKDPQRRPTAEDVLAHPWLASYVQGSPV